MSSFDTEQSFAKCVEAMGKNCNTKTPLGSAFESELLPQQSKLRTALFLFFFVYFFFIFSEEGLHSDQGQQLWASVINHL